MMYLFRRLAALVDGRRLVVDIDAFRGPRGDGGFCGLVRDGLKIGRKQNAFMVFATRSPADGSRTPSLSNARGASSQVSDDNNRRDDKIPKPSARAPIVPA